MLIWDDGRLELGGRVHRHIPVPAVPASSSEGVLLCGFDGVVKP